MSAIVCTRFPTPYLPTVLLPAETSIIQRAIGVAGNIEDQSARIAHRVYEDQFVHKQKSLIEHHPQTKNRISPPTLMQLFASEPPLTSEKLAGPPDTRLWHTGTASDANFNISALIALLKSYRYVPEGNDSYILSAALFALDRSGTIDMSHDLPGISPWMNAGINAVLEGKVVSMFDFDVNQLQASDTSSAEVSSSTNRNAESVAKFPTLHVSTEEWTKYLQWQLGPTSHSAKKVGDQGSASELLPLPTKDQPVELTYQSYKDRWWGSLPYLLRASLTDASPENIRLDISPVYSDVPDKMQTLINDITIQRGAAFLHGIKWWISTKPDMASLVTPKLEKGRSWSSIALVDERTQSWI